MTDAPAKPAGSLLSALTARWFWYSVLCLLCFAGFAIASKYGELAGLSGKAMYWLFIWGALPVGLVLLAARRFRLEKSPKGIGAALVFGTLGGLGQWMFLVAFEKGPDETAVITVVTGLYSMVTVALAVLFLRERLTLVQALGIAAAVAAVVVLSLPEEAAKRPTLGQVVRSTAAFPPWFWPAMVVLAGWGIVGVFQKVASNHISPESALVWQTVGFLLYLPVVWPQESLSKVRLSGLLWGMLAGMLTNLGTLFLVAAMKRGGKASIVAPLTTLFPLIVVFLAPFLFGQTITGLQWAGVGCAVVSILLLAR